MKALVDSASKVFILNEPSKVPFEIGNPLYDVVTAYSIRRITTPGWCTVVPVLRVPVLTKAEQRSFLQKMLETDAEFRKLYNMDKLFVPFENDELVYFFVRNKYTGKLRVVTEVELTEVRNRESLKLRYPGLRFRANDDWELFKETRPRLDNSRHLYYVDIQRNNLRDE
jgi:hypothetical protein